MGGKSNDEKQKKQKARELWGAAREAMAQGDYRRVRALDAEILALAPESEHGRQASVEAAGLLPDRVVLGAGAGAVALYVLAWLVALW